MNKVDILFIVDVTGSMGHFIDRAKDEMQKILKTLSEKHEVDLKVGLSLYRDHPPEDSDFVTVTFDLMDVKDITDKISEIVVGGGGDTPEAVLDGIIDGANDMKWRENARRIAFLIGDAPAHGMLSHEHKCACGNTWGTAICALENRRVTLYSILLSNDATAESNFKLLSNFTGGMLIEGDDVMNAIVDTLGTELDNVNLDAKVLEMLSSSKNPDEICELLNIDRDKLGQSKSRIAQGLSV